MHDTFRAARRVGQGRVVSRVLSQPGCRRRSCDLARSAPNAYEQLGTFTCTPLGSQSRTPTCGSATRWGARSALPAEGARLAEADQLALGQWLERSRLCRR